jgi:hypothetical protein
MAKVFSGIIWMAKGEAPAGIYIYRFSKWDSGYSRKMLQKAAGIKTSGLVS